MVALTVNCVVSNSKMSVKEFFANCNLSVKFAKIFSRKTFPLCGIVKQQYALENRDPGVKTKQMLRGAYILSGLSPSQCMYIRGVQGPSWFSELHLLSVQPFYSPGEPSN